MYIPKSALLLILPTALCKHLLAREAVEPIHVDVATGLHINAQPIRKDIGALSIEFCYAKDYLGDRNKPNALSLALLQNIQDISGSPPIIRLGGHTQDVTKFCPSCPDSLNNTYQPGNDEAIGVSISPSFFDVLNHNVPSKQVYVFGLNFGQNDVAIPLAEVEAVEKYLQPSRLLAYELGNEPDFYGPQRPKPWNVETFVAQQESWLDLLGQKTEKGFMLGALAQLPIYQKNFSLAEINKLGLPKKVDYTVSLSDHTYPFSVCDPERAALVSLPNLMNHTRSVSFFSQWGTEIQAARDAGVDFVMGETGSVSCHGKNGVSNTLGAALWQLDYMLNGAILGMSGVYFHMGAPFYYSMWQPAHNGTPAIVNPTYYSLLFMSTATKMDNPHVLALPVADPDLALYALYEGRPSSNTKPQKLVILNLGFLPAVSDNPVAPAKAIDVSKILGGRLLQVHRLSGPSSDATTGATWAGQDFSAGRAKGRKVVEKVGGVMTVRSSEAVIVERR